MNYKNLYHHRFSKDENHKRTLLWRELYRGFLYRYIRPTDTVCDIGAGSLEFLDVSVCKKKIAVDPLYRKLVVKQGIDGYPSVKYVVKKFRHSVDVVMLSNILEHMKDREEIISLLSTVRMLLKPGGSLLIIQPTIDLVGDRYWDFFDHIVPITRKSLQEVLVVSGFEIQKCIPRFLPYTTKTRFPIPPWMVRIYLIFPWFLRPFAGQCFIHAIPKI